MDNSRLAFSLLSPSTAVQAQQPQGSQDEVVREQLRMSVGVQTVPHRDRCPWSELAAWHGQSKSCADPEGKEVNTWHSHSKGGKSNHGPHRANKEETKPLFP